MMHLIRSKAFLGLIAFLPQPLLEGSLDQRFPAPSAREGLHYAQASLDERTQAPLIENPQTARDYELRGNTLLRRGFYPEAEVAYRRAVSLGSSSANVYSGLGQALLNQGLLEDALGECETALERYSLLIPAYECIITIHNRQRDFVLERTTYERAFNIVMNAQSADPDIYIGLGNLLGREPELIPQAVLAFERAIALEPSRPTTYLSLGKILRQQGNLEAAVSQLQQAIALSTSSRYRDILIEACDVLNTANLLLSREGEQPTACSRLSASFTAEDYFDRGREFSQSGDFGAALEAYNQAIALGADLSPAYLAAAHNNRGRALAALENFDQAIESYQQALNVQPDINTYINLGITYQSLGRLDDALNAYQQIDSFLAILETLPASPEDQDLFLSLARGQQDYERYSDRVYDLANKQRYYETYIDLLMALHKNYPEQRFDLKALEVSERARSRSLLERLTAANAYQAADPALWQQERMLRQKIKQGIEQWSALGGALSDLRAKLFSNSDTMEIQSGNDSVQDDSTNAAVALSTTELQTMQLQAIGDEDSINEQEAANLAEREALLAQLRDLWQQYSALQGTIRENNPNYAEIAQPRILKSQDIQSLLRDDDTLLLEYWLGEDKSYLWAISRHGIRTYDLPSRGIIDEATRNFYNFLTVPDQRVQIVNTAIAGQELSQMILGPVANELGRKRLVIVADGALSYIPFNALPSPMPFGTQREISANSLPNPLIDDHEIVNLPSASVLAALRQRAPLRQPSRQLAVIADPVFSPNDERFLAIREQTQTQQDEAVLDNQDDAEGAVNIDNVLNGLSRLQALPGTSQEADSIIKFASEQRNPDFVKVWQGFQANRQEIIDSLGNFRIIHFATHGILNDENPQRSGFLLSQIDSNGDPQESNGFLLLEDIFQLELSADLVVLSGCRTGLGTYLRGEGLLGLTQGFMYAGAERAIVSLWSVDDDATAVLMDLFYREFVDKGRPPAQALRTAQYNLRAKDDGTWENPYYWAAFVLYGDWEYRD